MKRTLLCAVCAALLITTQATQAKDDWGEDDTKTSYDEATRAIVLRLLKQHSPDGLKIIEGTSDYPSQVKIGELVIPLTPKVDYMQFVEGTGVAAVVQRIGTVVHEQCHLYQNILAFLNLKRKKLPFEAGFLYYGYYVGGGESILVKYREAFPTRDTAEAYPGELREGRYETYVATSDTNHGTSGVFGLLDEYFCYYHGLKAELDFYPVVQKEMPQTVQTWLDYLAGYFGLQTSYYEFRIYIARYLLHAQEHKPEIFQEILENAPFRKAFRANSESFRKLLSSWARTFEKIKADLKAKGFEAEQSGGFFRLGTSAEDRSGRGMFEDRLRVYKEELNRPEIKKILAELER